MRKSLALILFLILLTGCGAPATPTATVTPTPLPFSTATLVPSVTPRPSLTPAPPTIAPTVVPVTGMLSTQVNVRSAPAANAPAIGLLNPGDTVQVLGRDSDSKWLMVIYPANSSTTAWVTVDYVKLDGAELDRLPVMQASLPAAPAQPAETATSTPNPYTARVTKTINVRAGPATSYDSLGMINAETIVVITGRNQINTWMQIEFAGGADGRGWVAAAYVDNPYLQGLPYFDNDGKVVFAPTADTNPPGQPTLTPTGFSPAAGDGDSEQKPAVLLEFSPSGAESLTYSSELSSPNGDDADWVAFIPYIPTSEAGYVYMRLRCTGNGGVTASLEKDGLPVPEVPQLQCGNYGLAMKVLGGQTYMLVLRAGGSAGPLRYANYTLTISTNP